METLTLSGALIAVVEWLKTVDTQNKIDGWVTLPVVVVLGALAGYLHLLGTVSVNEGLTAALFAVGIHTTARAFGGKNQ